MIGWLVLGALLTFAPAPLYAPHRDSTAAWSLTPLADQQLGGLLCWIVGCTLFLTAGLRCVALVLRGQLGADDSPVVQIANIRREILAAQRGSRL